MTFEKDRKALPRSIEILVLSYSDVATYQRSTGKDLGQGSCSVNSHDVWAKIFRWLACGSQD